MACLTPQVLKYLSTLVSWGIAVNLFIYIIYMIKHQDHTFIRYKVLFYWALSVLLICLNPNSKSFYLLILTLVFGLQSVILSFLHLEFLEIAWITQGLALIIGKLLIEFIIRKYVVHAVPDPEAGNDRRTATNQINEQKLKIRVWSLITLIYSIVYYEYTSLAFWDQINREKIDILYTISLVILQLVLLFLLNVIVYNRSCYFLSMLVITVIAIVFYFNDYLVNLIILLVYLAIILVAYIIKLCEGKNTLVL